MQHLVRFPVFLAERDPNHEASLQNLSFLRQILLLPQKRPTYIVGALPQSH